MKIKAIFANRKFSRNGLIEVIFNITAFIGLIVAFAVIIWLSETYPIETGACVVCAILLILVVLAMAGLIDTIFPKRDDSEYVDAWVKRAKDELKKHRK